MVVKIYQRLIVLMSFFVAPHIYAYEYLPDSVSIVEPPDLPKAFFVGSYQIKNNLVLAQVRHTETWETEAPLDAAYLYRFENNSWKIETSVHFDDNWPILRINSLSEEQFFITKVNEGEWEVLEYKKQSNGDWALAYTFSRELIEDVTIKDGLLVISGSGDSTTHPDLNTNASIVIFESKSNGWEFKNEINLEDFGFNSQTGLRALSLSMNDGYLFGRICPFSGRCEEGVYFELELLTNQIIYQHNVPQNLGLLFWWAIFDERMERMVVTYQPEPGGMGGIYLYFRNGDGEWELKEEIVPDDFTMGFAMNSFIGNETIFTLGRGDFSESAKVLLFGFMQDEYEPWSEKGQIVIPDGLGYKRFFTSVKADGNRLAIYDNTSNSSSYGRIFIIDDFTKYYDLDKDSMPLWWEELYGYSDSTFEDHSLDVDNDGLSGIEEHMYLTSPVKLDTDGDRMADGWEIANKFDPLSSSDGQEDHDSDGFSNAEEYLAGTDPYNSQSIPQSASNSSESSGSGGANLPIFLFMLLLLCVMRRQKQNNG